MDNDTRQALKELAEAAAKLGDLYDGVPTSKRHERLRRLAIDTQSDAQNILAGTFDWADGLTEEA